MMPLARSLVPPPPSPPCCPPPRSPLQISMGLFMEQWQSILIGMTALIVGKLGVMVFSGAVMGLSKRDCLRAGELPARTPTCMPGMPARGWDTPGSTRVVLGQAPDHICSGQHPPASGCWPRSPPACPPPPQSPAAGNHLHPAGASLQGVLRPVCRASRAPAPSTFLPAPAYAGLLLATGGEFAFVAFGEAVSHGLLTQPVASQLYLVSGHPGAPAACDAHQPRHCACTCLARITALRMLLLPSSRTPPPLTPPPPRAKASPPPLPRAAMRRWWPCPWP